MSNFDWLRDASLWIDGRHGRQEKIVPLAYFLGRSGVKDEDWQLDLLAWRCGELAESHCWYDVSCQGDHVVLVRNR